MSGALKIAAAVLVLCTALQAQSQTLSPLVSAQSAQPAAPWRVVGLPKARADIALTHFDVATVQGERALRVSTQASYGTLVHELPRMPAGRLQWRWRLDQPLSGGINTPNILTKGGDDAALKVCVMFEHPLDHVPFVERTKLRLARSLSGEDLPAATLCYVWDSTHPAGTHGANPYSRRVRFISLQGHGAPLAQWQSESRDVAADFAQLFADESPADAPTPNVRAVLVGADSDNTGSRSLGWLASLGWTP
ncbi:MAG: DUF3047 domain-containing protein [Limnohabitans sp.]